MSKQFKMFLVEILFRRVTKSIQNLLLNIEFIWLRDFV